MVKSLHRDFQQIVKLMEPLLLPPPRSGHVSGPQTLMLSNREPTDCQFLLLQGVGKYDWNKAEG